MTGPSAENQCGIGEVVFYHRGQAEGHRGEELTVVDGGLGSRRDGRKEAQKGEAKKVGDEGLTV